MLKLQLFGHCLAIVVCLHRHLVCKHHIFFCIESTDANRKHNLQLQNERIYEFFFSFSMLQKSPCKIKSYCVFNFLLDFIIVFHFSSINGSNTSLTRSIKKKLALFLFANENKREKTAEKYQFNVV